MVFDIRAENAALIDEFTAALDAESRSIAARTNVERSRYAVLSSTPHTPCDAGLRDLLARGASALGYSTMPLASGAGHDTAFRGAHRPGGDAVRALPRRQEPRAGRMGGAHRARRRSGDALRGGAVLDEPHS